MNTIGDFLDANWISNVLSISFTLVVFLLGVPVVFIQTYVPENLRKYYVIKQKRQIDLLNICIVILIITTVLFGNQGFKYLLINVHIEDFPLMLKDQIFVIKKLLTRDLLLKVYYFVSLLFFLFTILLVYGIFNDIVFRKEDIKVEIIRDVFRSLKIDIDIYLLNDLESEREKIISTFTDFSYIFRSGYERAFFLEETIKLIEFVKGHENYSGKQIKDIFGGLIEFIYLKDFSECTKGEIENLLDLCNKVSTVNTKDSADNEFFNETFLFVLYKKLIDANYIKLAQYVVEVMKNFNISQPILFRVYYYAYENNLYKQLFIEIAFVVKEYSKRMPIDEYRKTLVRNNLVAYLALLYNHNSISKDFIIEKIKVINRRLDNEKITLSDFNKAQWHFTEDYRLDTAQKIFLMKNEYFKLKNIINRSA